MKIRPVSTDFFRQAPVIRFDGVSPVARRETVRYVRRFTRITRYQESLPVKIINGLTSSASHSRKCNPLKPVKKVGVVTSPKPAWRNRKAVTVAKIVKAYEAYDHISPIGYDSNGFFVYLSDIVDPHKWLDIDFDARQEAEEATYRRFEKYDVRDEMVVEGLGQQVEMSDWDGNFTPSFRADGTFFIRGWQSPPLPTWLKQLKQVVTTYPFGLPWPVRRLWSPADLKLLCEPIVEEPMTEAAPDPFVNDVLMTPPPSPFSTCSAFVQPAWPPVDKDVAMTPPLDTFTAQSLPVVDHPQFPAVNDVPMTPPDSFTSYSPSVFEPAQLSVFNSVFNDVPMTPPVDLFPAYSPFNGHTSVPVANDSPMTPAPAPFTAFAAPVADSGFVDSCFSGWTAPPPVANDVNVASASTFPQPLFSSVDTESLQQPMLGKYIVEPAPTPISNNVDMTFKPTIPPLFFFSVGSEASQEPDIDVHTVETAQPPITNSVNVASASTFPQSLFASGAAEAFHQPMLGKYIVERAPTPVCNNDNAVANVAAINAAHPEYQGLLEEVTKFDAGAMKEPGAIYEKMKDDSYQPEFDGRTLNSLANYPSHPCRYSLKETPSFPCLTSGDSYKALGSSARKAVAKHYADLWRDHPDVWEALLGTMLQEGVTTDSLLLNHKEKDEVLDHKTWILDLFRFDEQHCCGQQGIPLRPGILGEFHKAPQGQGKAKVYYDEVHYLKSQPMGVQHALRTLVSVWLKTEGRVEVFRNIARKAGWVPQDEYRVVVLRNFIIDTFKNRPVELLPFYSQTQEYLIKRYPRFLAATMAEEGIDCDLSYLC